MSLYAYTVWEVRSTGNANNGAGFNDRIPGTSIDYSQQNASQLSITDLVGAAASVTVTSAIGGFTNAMVGNLMKIRAGTNFTPGYYEIVQYNSANSVDLDRSPCTGAGSGGTAEVGGAASSLADIISALVTGNTVYIKNGTYTATAALTHGTIGSVSAPVYILGYDTVRGDNPTGTNRPLLDMAAYSYTLPKVAIHRNLRIQGSNNSLITSDGTGSYYYFRNVYFKSTATSGTKYIITTGSYEVIYINCEFAGSVGATSYGIYVSSTGIIKNIAINCYFHDLTYAAYNISDVSFCIFNRCSRGIYESGSSMIESITNCTFNQCYKAIQSGGMPVVINCIFSDITNYAINTSSRIMRNNLFWNCAHQTTNEAYNNYKIEADPQFTDPGADNFSLQRTSPAIDAAMYMRLGV